MDELQACGTPVEDEAPLEVEELVGDVVVEVLDVEVVGSVWTIADNAPLPAMGVASVIMNGDPTSQTGWSWPEARTRELQQ